MTEKRTHPFQAEVSQVLSLVINSLYSHKEIFLRELLSNASDALDKLRFEAIGKPELIPDDQTLTIRITPDKTARTLTIADNGIGMTPDELVDHLGTIARSGSRAFLERLQQAQKGDVNLIGQFGVGFYSAYLVADQVEVVSRAAGHREAARWSSDAKESFTIEPAQRPEQGTSVILHLKEEHQDFLEEYRLRELVRRYSDYLGYPIELELPQKESEAARVETINQGKALWRRPPSEVTKEQYEEFYKHLTHDWDNPLAHRHFRIEGTQEFIGLVFVPKRPPFDLFSPDGQHGVRLHVKRVFVMDDCEELLPKWLRFIRGLVDSEDLPLNVSRETLQDSRIVQVIRKQVVKHSLDMLDDVAKEESEAYDQFWEQFGAVLKEGLHFDAQYKDRLMPLVRYRSSRAEGLTSLEQYIERMEEGQKAIYYATGDSLDHLQSSPHLEALKKKGYEVLYMTDPVDAWAVAQLDEFDGKKFVSATSSELKLEDAEEKEGEQPEAAVAPLLERFRKRLQDHVSEVRVSDRLVDSPVCLVVPEGGLQPHIERLMRATRGSVPRSKRILEVNPAHPLIENLQKLSDNDDKSEQLNDWIDLLFDQALLAEGSPVDDPARVASQLAQLLHEVSGHALRSPSS